MEPNTQVEAPQVGAPVDIASIDALLAQANLARIRGQWQVATDICIRVLRAEPGNVNAHALLGDIYRDQGAIDDAIQWYRMAVDLRANPIDQRKLSEMEAERARRLSQAPATSGALSGSLHPDGSVTGGTTQLMGMSPRRWLRTLTLVSVAFLAATLLLLVLMQNGPKQGAPIARTQDISSHPVMPTADAGISLPSPSNPNRPTVLPSGESTRIAPVPHQTGDGLPPDLNSSSRTAPVSQPVTPREEPPRPAPRTGVQNREIPPAPVQAVQPLNVPAPLENPTGAANTDSNGTASGSRAMRVAGETRDPDRTGQPESAPADTADLPDRGQ